MFTTVFNVTIARVKYACRAAFGAGSGVVAGGNNSGSALPAAGRLRRRAAVLAAAAFLALPAMFWAVPARAQLNVTISGAQQAPIPVAFPKIISDNSAKSAFDGKNQRDDFRGTNGADEAGCNFDQHRAGRHCQRGRSVPVCEKRPFGRRGTGCHGSGTAGGKSAAYAGQCCRSAAYGILFPGIAQCD